MSDGLTIDVTVADEGWQDDLDDPDGRAGAAVRAAIGAAMGTAAPGLAPYDSPAPAGCAPYEGLAEVSVVFADDAAVRKLNAAYRDRDSATNVLAFPVGEEAGAGAGGPRLWGDIVLARETIGQEAQAQAKTLADHVSHLIVHGMLHLMGFDHGDEASADAMEAIEVRALAGLGIGDPYAASEAGPAAAAAQ